MTRRREIIADITINILCALMLAVAIPISIVAMLGFMVFDAIVDLRKRLPKYRRAL